MIEKYVIILISIHGKELAESIDAESCSDLDSSNDDWSVLNGAFLCSYVLFVYTIVVI